MSKGAGTPVQAFGPKQGCECQPGGGAPRVAGITSPSGNGMVEQTPPGMQSSPPAGWRPFGAGTRSEGWMGPNGQLTYGNHNAPSPTLLGSQPPVARNYINPPVAGLLADEQSRIASHAQRQSSPIAGLLTNWRAF